MKLTDGFVPVSVARPRSHFHPMLTTWRLSLGSPQKPGRLVRDPKIGMGAACDFYLCRWEGKINFARAVVAGGGT